MVIKAIHSQIHNFLVENKFWYTPSRNDSGALSFKVRAFTEGTENFNKMKVLGRYECLVSNY